MTPIEIKASLLLRRTTAARIARDLGLSRAAVSAVINGHNRTPHVRRRVAEVIGISYALTWGEPDPGIDRLRAGRKRLHTSTHSPQDGVA